jgi:enoyl-CoA hydratase
MVLWFDRDHEVADHRGMACIQSADGLPEARRRDLSTTFPIGAVSGSHLPHPTRYRAEQTTVSKTYSTIELEVDEAVATIRLNVPKTLNALSRTLTAEVMDSLDTLADDDAIRAVILTGSGRAFSSGYDLSTPTDNAERSVIGYKNTTEQWTHPFVMKVWNFPKPIIAAVHGYCLAGACEVAMLCDITIASEDCRLGEPEIRFSSASPTLIMPWLVPMKIAKQLLFTGEMIAAQRAYEIGMVNEVVPADQLMNQARKRAAIIAKVAPLAVRLTKEGINKTYEIMGLNSALSYHNAMANMLDGTGTAELREFVEIASRDGLRAALDWRDGQFRDLESSTN